MRLRATWAQGLSPFPYALIYPQDEHERLLIDRLAEAGVQVERGTEILGVDEASDHVLARLKRPDGAQETCEAAYVAGCDGAHSTVRETLGIGFPGGTYAHLFYVADVEARGPPTNGELHVGLDTTDFLAVFPLKADGHVRLVGTVREEPGHPHETLSWDDVSQRVIEWMRIDVEKVNWFSTYRVHHRVADHFRTGRAFLLGDAAHIHSPVGGQGMNTGIGDAVNLAWKLAAVVHGRADASLLDSYEPERIAFARRLVATTDRAFTGVTSSGSLARFVRLSLVTVSYPAAFPRKDRAAADVPDDFADGGELPRKCLERGTRGKRARRRPSAVGQSGVARRRRGQFHAADFAGLAGARLRRSVRRGVGRYAIGEDLPLHVFAWHPAVRRTGLRRNAVYLVRPDGYVALADPAPGARTVSSYLDVRKLTPRTPS